MSKMNQTDLIVYWYETADKDFKTMMNLFDSGDYHWALFLGHMVIEKLLKAVYVKKISSHAPRIHDLLRLSEMAGLTTTEYQKDLLDKVTTFNISVRYPDYQQKFYQKCTPEFTLENIDQIKELRAWLIDLIEKK